MTANTLLAAALAPLAARMPRVVRHREILRVAGTLAAVAPSAAASEARRQALRWAQKRCGGRLPEAAWAEESFEYLAGGRTSLGIRFQDGNIDEGQLQALSGQALKGLSEEPAQGPQESSVKGLVGEARSMPDTLFS